MESCFKRQQLKNISLKCDSKHCYRIVPIRARGFVYLQNVKSRQISQNPVTYLSGLIPLNDRQFICEMTQRRYKYVRLDRLRTVSWSDSSHQTGMVNVRLKGSTLPCNQNVKYKRTDALSLWHQQ